jgi:peptide deformylase
MSDKPKLESLRIVHYPAPILHTRAAAIAERDFFLQELGARMYELMREAGGMGLAANQVGLPQRLIVVQSPGQEGRYEVFVNPAIISREGALKEEEGCLSVPGVNAKVRRAQRVVVEATTLAGERVRIEAQDLAARLWQHEIDHLDGMLFIDKIGPAARLLLRSRLRALEEKQGHSS